MAEKKVQLLEKDKADLLTKVQQKNSMIDDLNAEVARYENIHYEKYKEQLEQIDMERRIGYLEQDKKNLQTRVNDLLNNLNVVA